MNSSKSNLLLAVAVVLFLCAVTGVRNMVNPSGRSGVVMAMSTAAPYTYCCSGMPIPDPGKGHVVAAAGPEVSSLASAAPYTSCCSGMPIPDPGTGHVVAAASPAISSLASTATYCCSGMPIPDPGKGHIVASALPVVPRRILPGGSE